MTQIQLVEKPVQPVLSVRTRTSMQELPGFLGKTYGQIMQILGARGQEPAGPPYAAYYNMDMENLDVEAGFPVAQTTPGQGEVQAGVIPGGKQATAMHVGPYDKCAPVYQAMNEWITQHGYESAGPAYEFYLNDPSQVSPEELQMQIVFPLKG